MENREGDEKNGRKERNGEKEGTCVNGEKKERNEGERGKSRLHVRDKKRGE
jgi:hypothetical protein